VETVKEVLLPDIGDFPEVDIIEVLVAPGDTVEAEDSLLTLESDKATMEIPAPFAGKVKEVNVKVGDKVSEGGLLALIEVSEGIAEQPSASEQTDTDMPHTAAEEVEQMQAPTPATNQPPPQAPTAPQPKRLPGDKKSHAPPVLARPSDRPAGKPHASPAVRRFARELGVDLTQVAGSAPKGRITKDDVQNFIKRALSEGAAAPPSAASPFQLPAAPEVDFAKFGEVEVQALSRIRKISGTHLHRCWLSVPHVTQFDEADITGLEAFRKAQKDDAAQQNIRLTFMPFLMKAVAAALKAMPVFNSSLAADGESLILKHYINIGIAVDTANGLVVPVLRDVDKKGIFELARELMAISGRARDGKLAPSEMQGGCFSISSLGGIGGTAFTPIVNAPEVAILGVSRSEMKPKWNGSEFEPRLMLPLSLSYDHRVVDGADGVRFTALLSQLLSDIRRLLL
jgi:pyruvate dehydrogenase E2 component (dihydrolipoamide acetyltransferase)